MSQTSLQIQIMTPERIVYDQEVYGVTLPTTSGEITVYAHHIPLVTTLGIGEMRVHMHNGDTYPFAVAEGIAEIKKGNHIVILTPYSERAEEIDLKEAEAAYARAEQAMQEKVHADDRDFGVVQAIMMRELNRVRIATRYRR
jgi:F-type H+-transporting ATPase subunit epsilon